MADIDHWRKKIDGINLKLVELLNERSQCAIERVQDMTRGPLTKEAIRRLFERIIDESRRAERESSNHEAELRRSERSDT